MHHIRLFLIKNQVQGRLCVGEKQKQMAHVIIDVGSDPDQLHRIFGGHELAEICTGYKIVL